MNSIDVPGVTGPDGVRAVSKAASRVVIRVGGVADRGVVLALWDTAIAWLVQRGQPQQWGREPASSRPRTREMVDQWLGEPGLRIAEIDGRPVGASVVGTQPPAHVPATPLRETYLLFLISDRRHAGLGIGCELVRRAAAEAREAGSQVLRVDCWAGAPALVAWYERQGFTRSENFTVEVRGPWHGQVFEMRL
ncbi:MAG: GNAT family N-acetyltransferase [Solirubrobacteraceae bacterium]